MSQRVLVLGAGPIGLEAALYAAEAGLRPEVLEAGVIGEHCRRWGHVRLFTPWALNASPLARRKLDPAGLDDDARPTGAELAAALLEPLAALPELSGRVRTRHRVVGIARGALLKGEGISDGTRDPLLFRVLADTPEGEREFTADAVIDATGVFGQPNPLGAGGIPAPGERGLGELVLTGVPDVLGHDRSRVAGRRVLVVGGGLSAATTVVALAEAGAAEVVWLTRSPGTPAPVIDGDPLPARAALAAAANDLAARGAVRHVRGDGVTAAHRAGNEARVTLAGPAGPAALVCDVIVNQTGFRPDASIHRELQVHQCYASEGTMKLAAALLGAGGGDCMEQSGHGPESLINPEPGFFVLGNKSYGRNPDFLLRIGHEQVRDAFRLITGDAALDLYAGAPARA